MRQLILFLCVIFAGCSFSATSKHPQNLAKSSTQAPLIAPGTPVSEYADHTSRYALYDEPPIILKIVNPKYRANARASEMRVMWYSL